MSVEVIKALNPVGAKSRIVDPGPITAGTPVAADLSAYIGKIVVMEACDGDIFFFCAGAAADVVAPATTTGSATRGRRIPSGQEREFKITSDRCFFEFDTTTSNAEVAIYEASL